MGYGVIGSPTVSGSVSLGSSPGTPARNIGPEMHPRSCTAPSSSGPGRRPLTAVARVRIPSGLRAREPPTTRSGALAVPACAPPPAGAVAEWRVTAPSSSGPGRRPLTAVARVRIPSGLHRARAPGRPAGGSRRPGPSGPMIDAGDSVAAVIRTSRRLADGREILYFDDRTRSARRRRHPRPARRSPPGPSCATTRCWASGWPSPPTGRRAPSCRRPTSARSCPSRPGRPTEIPESDYQVVVFENRFPSLATGVDRRRAGRRRRAPRWPSCGRASGAARSSASPTSTTACSPTWARSAPGWSSTSGPSGRRRWARIDGIEQVFLLREPRRGDRGDAVAPPRADLRLPVPDRRGWRRSWRRCAGTGRRPAATCSPTSSPPSAPGRAWSRRTSTGRRSSRPPPAGPTRCSCSPPARCPTSRRSPTRSATPSSRSTSTCCPLRPPVRTPRCPTSPPGTRRRCSEGRDDWWLHLQLFSLRRAPGKMKYLAGSESGMGAFITDTNPEDVAEQLRAVVVT